MTTSNYTSAISSNFLPSRYEIRLLHTPEHLEWASAIAGHSNSYRGKVFPALYKSDACERFARGTTAMSPYIALGIDSGLSYGVFDTEYVYKRPESAAKGGAFYFDPSETNLTGAELLERMDFPLVSIALAYDAYKGISDSELASITNVFPVMADIFGELSKMPNWTATRPGQIMKRNSTSTREDYEGRGLMKGLQHFLMWKAHELGFEGVQMDQQNPAVRHVWLHPPSPFEARLVGEFEIGEIVRTVEGREVRPYKEVQQLMTRIWVDLKNGGEMGGEVQE